MEKSSIFDNSRKRGMIFEIYWVRDFEIDYDFRI
jgi:hypothetical protein